MEDSDKQEIMDELKEHLTQMNPTTPLPPAPKTPVLASFPGGLAGAMLALGIVSFFVKDTFGEHKASQDKLTTLSTNQTLILDKLTRMESAGVEAGKRFSDLEDELEEQKEALHSLSSWQKEADKDIGTMEDSLDETIDSLKEVIISAKGK